VQATLILTAVELEAHVLARALELPPLPALSFAAFGRGGTRVAAVGLRAGLLPLRWPHLVVGLGEPLIVSAGVCGGLDPALASGTLVVPESVIDPDGALARVTPSAHQAALASAPSARTARLVTTRDVAATADAKASLRRRTGAIAVDMESSIIVAAASGAGLPSLAVRGVADTAAEGLPPELIGLMRADGRLRVARAAALAVRPAILPRALALRRATTTALRAVGRLLAALVVAPR
jgi:adenosylhomocysteine nucleosidase